LARKNLHRVAMTPEEFAEWARTCGFDTLETASLALGGRDGDSICPATVSRWRSGAAPMRNDVAARLARAMMRHPALLAEIREEVAEALLTTKAGLRLMGPADDVTYEVKELMDDVDVEQE
jgi:hypothetical protein